MEAVVDPSSVDKATSESSDVRASVRVVDDGPLVVRGPVRLVDETGREIPVRRRVNALCRCGRSSIQPFCDSTHRIVPFSPRAASGNGDAARETASPTA